MTTPLRLACYALGPHTARWRVRRKTVGKCGQMGRLRPELLPTLQRARFALRGRYRSAAQRRSWFNWGPKNSRSRPTVTPPAALRRATGRRPEVPQ